MIYAFKKCPFCGQYGHVKIESKCRRKERIYGDEIELRTYHVRCTCCGARGGTVTAWCSYNEKDIKIYGEKLHIRSYEQLKTIAMSKWNTRNGEKPEYGGEYGAEKS